MYCSGVVSKTASVATSDGLTCNILISDGSITDGYIATQEFRTHLLTIQSMKLDGSLRVGKSGEERHKTSLEVPLTWRFQLFLHATCKT